MLSVPSHFTGTLTFCSFCINCLKCPIVPWSADCSILVNFLCLFYNITGTCLQYVGSKQKVVHWVLVLRGLRGGEMLYIGEKLKSRCMLGHIIERSHSAGFAHRDGANPTRTVDITTTASWKWNMEQTSTLWLCVWLRCGLKHWDQEGHVRSRGAGLINLSLFYTRCWYFLSRWWE